MGETEESPILLKQASFRKLAIPLFLATTLVYFFVAVNQCTKYGSFDKTFLLLGGFYACLTVLYLIHSATERRRKFLSQEVSRKQEDN